MTTKQRLLCVALIAIAGCGGTQVTPTTLDEPAATTTTAPSTTTTNPPTTTTTEAMTTTEATTTTTTPPSPIVLATDYTTSEGWEYRVRIEYDGTDPSRSEGECLDVAPPGQTYLIFGLFIWNEIADREAPMAQLNAGTTLVDGEPVDGEPQSDEVIILQGGKPTVEIVPNAPGTQCLFANGLSDDAAGLPPGDYTTHRMTVGPVNEESVDDVLVGLRFFLEPGVYIPATLTNQDGSGVVGDVVNLVGG
jgi:hypothetical protein